MPTMVDCQCTCCSREFKRTLSTHNQAVKKGQKPYCSRDCWYGSLSPKVEVQCCKCGKRLLRQPGKIKGRKRFYCSDCRGEKVTLTCQVCSGEFTIYKSQADWNKSKYCSIKCKSIGQRVPWDELTRGMLKHRYMKEFGEDSLVCGRCGHDKPYNIAIHHKEYLCNGGKTEPSNLEPICLNCHGIEHYDNGPDTNE